MVENETMKSDEYSGLQKSSFERRLAITEKKRKDYADDVDVLANFKRIGGVAKTLRIHTLWEKEPALAYSLFMALMKIDRIVNLTIGDKKPQNESILDTFDDALNYIDLAQAILTETGSGDTLK